MLGCNLKGVSETNPDLDLHAILLPFMSRSQPHTYPRCATHRTWAYVNDKAIYVAMEMSMEQESEVAGGRTNDKDF
jgi:hypothetical protein